MSLSRLIQSSGWTPIEGRTLLIQSGPAKHLFIILTAPAHDGLCALVNVSSIYEGVYHDPSCVVAVGEHPFITRPSYVVYARARITPAIGLIHGVRSGTIVPRQPASAALFERVCDGALLSDDLPQKIGTFLRQRFAAG